MGIIMVPSGQGLPLTHIQTAPNRAGRVSSPYLFALIGFLDSIQDLSSLTASERDVGFQKPMGSFKVPHSLMQRPRSPRSYEDVGGRGHGRPGLLSMDSFQL